MKYLIVIAIMLIGCDQSGGEWEAPPWHTSFRDECKIAEPEEMEDYSCVCVETTYGEGRTYYDVEASSWGCARQEALDQWGMDCDAAKEEDPSVLCYCSCEEE